MKRKQINILIADDHAIFRAGLRSLLESEEDFVVTNEAGDGFQAVKMALEAKTADLMILDVSMPGLSGAQIAAEVLKEKPQFKIIILTMHEDEYYLNEFLRIGVKGYVLKKSTGSELTRAIRVVNNGGSFIDPALSHFIVSRISGLADPSMTELNLISRREQEILKLLALGHTNEEVGNKLCISRRTVDTHRANIMTKLSLSSRAELVRFALDHGLLKSG